MKKALSLFVTLFVLAFFATSSFAQNPTYTLKLKNGTPLASVTNQYEFDIELTCTGNGPMELAGHQYFMDFNPGISNGGTLTYSIVTTSYPSNMNVRNPTISGTQLRLAANTPPGAGNGYIMNVGVPNFTRMRITTSAPLFALVPLNIVWRNGPTNPFTKITAYVGTSNTEITTAATHTNELSNDPLPVELTSFTSTVNRNNVALTWGTAREVNNQGFDVERKLTSSNDWVKVGTVAGHGTTEEAKSYNYTERVNTGNYNYRLKQVDFNGNFEYFSLSNEVNVGVPSEYAMSQNYPNPFNPSTKIDYDIAFDGKVNIVLFDMSGREVSTLVNDAKPAGYYTISFNASNLSSGMYFYRITANGTNGSNFSQTKKMVLVK